MSPWINVSKNYKIKSEIKDNNTIIYLCTLMKEKISEE